MSTLARLATFVSAVALTAGGAAVIGSATGATPPFQSCLTAYAGDTAAHGMAGEAMTEAVPGSDGTRETLSGVSLLSVPSAHRAGGVSTWHFMVTDCDGNAIRSFERDQTKLLHLIVSRSDLTGYQHLHPTLGRDGVWSVDIEFAKPGRYRAIADFPPGGKRYVLGTPLVAPGIATDTPLPPASTSATDGGYGVELQRPAVLKAGREAELTFKV